MSTVPSAKTEIPEDLDVRILPRIVEEGYGPGAWHGADLRAALADVVAAQAYWRPAPGRHNIAEIALHHAYCARSVRGQLTGLAPEPFALEGEDWFPLGSEKDLAWTRVRAVLESEQSRLAQALGGAAALGAAQRFELVLGITCHAVYHAGQVQLLKQLQG